MTKHILYLLALFMFCGFLCVMPATAQQKCGDDDYDCKIAYQTTLIQSDPKGPEAYYNRALAYSKKGEYSLAFKDLNKYVSLPNTNTEYLADGYADRGWVQYKLEDLPNALADYNKAISVYPKHSLAYYRRGVLYSRQKKWQLAISDYDRSVQLDPEQHEAYYGRGEAYRLMENYDKALSEYTMYIGFNSANNEYMADGYRGRGMAYIANGKYNLAVQDLNKAIELDPSVAKSYTQRAIAYRKLGKTALADADDAKAKELQ